VNRDLFFQSALSTLLTLSALVLLCLVLVKWIWLWLAPMPEAPAPAALASTAAPQSAYHLFGHVPPVQTQTQLASTGIAVRLLGIVAAQGDGEGYAVLMLPPGDILAVREGQEFAPGIRLNKVNSDHLILERGGVRETLAWPQP